MLTDLEFSDGTHTEIGSPGTLTRETGPRILLIGDHPAMLSAESRRAFCAAHFQLITKKDGASAIQSVRSDPPDVILLDFHLRGESAMELYREIREINQHLPVIFVTLARTADPTIEVMKMGAFDCLCRPLEPQTLMRSIQDALDLSMTIAAANSAPCEPDLQPDGGGQLFGSSPAMREVYKALGRVAAQDVPVLITGESGTGKELVARALVEHGSRSNAPFLALNCAAIPENLLESELFGHEKGAFTGADRQRVGKFEQYTGGTILLDEIGDMPLGLQAKILRLVQDQCFQRVGGNQTVQTNVRIIAATHRDLKALVAAESFRRDLYYRLSVFTLHLPPLRDRGEDLTLLARQFVRRYSRELGRDVTEIAPEAMRRLRAYSWPGNIRELQSVLKQALLRASGAVLLPAFLPDTFDTRERTPVHRALESNLDAFVRARLNTGATNLYAQVHEDLDQHFLPAVLDHTGGNQREAARILGIARQTLRQRLREMGLSVSHKLNFETAESPQ